MARLRCNECSYFCADPKDAQGQPARFHVGAERELSIAADFAGFGSEITALRKRLRGGR